MANITGNKIFEEWDIVSFVVSYFIIASFLLLVNTEYFTLTLFSHFKKDSIGSILPRLICLKLLY